MLHLVLLAEGVSVPANLLARCLREPASLLGGVGLCPDFSEQSSVLESLSGWDSVPLTIPVASVTDSDFVWLIRILVDYRVG